MGCLGNHKVLNNIFLKFQVWKFLTIIIWWLLISSGEEKKTCFHLQVKVREDQALKVEGAESINRSQIGGKTNSLGSSERKSSIIAQQVEGAELIIEIQIRRYNVITWLDFDIVYSFTDSHPLDEGKYL